MEPGSHVGHFEIVEQLGAGGMGVVFRARDRVLHRDVALKLVRPGEADPAALGRFLQEARIAATLSHPGIAAIYEAGTLADAPAAVFQMYVAQELVEGETLGHAIARRGPLPLPEAADIAVQLLDALGEAHGRGIVHRDIKPSNLMLTPAGRLKVLDFGIARRLVSPTATTRLLDDTLAAAGVGAGSSIAGTPGYMAPEQLRGISDPRTDLFAAGCVLYELLTGERLFHAPPGVAAGAAPPSPAAALQTLRPDLAPAVGAVVERAVAADLSDRFPDAAAFRRALEAAADPSRSAGAALPGWKSRRALVAVGAVLLAFFAVAAAWLLSRPALAFGERDWVLIASVVNETGDPVFDSALEGALETDLRQSRYVNVFDQGQLANSLQMMRLPASTRIDLATGRNVCRLAGIRVLLVPKILSVGGAYQLEASLVEPASGRVVDRLRVTARGREDVLITGINQFTRLVRRRLGESLAAIEKTSPALVEYATPSWEALRYVRLGGEALAESDTPRAARAFEQALEHDPTFPAALVSLGLLYVELLNRKEEGLRLIASGFEHSSNTSEREYLMVRALHKQFVTGDPAGALEDYRLVSTLYPDMFQPYHNSGRILRQLGRYPEAFSLFDKAHALDPRHAVPLWNLWDLSLNQLENPRRAESYVTMLAALQPDNPWIRHIVAWTDVALRRFEPAEEGMREVLATVPLHAYAFPNLGHLLLRRGAAAEAVDVYRELLAKAREGLIDTAEADAALFLGLALTAAGDSAAARATYEREIARLTSVAGPSNLYSRARLSALQAAAGRRRDAERLLAQVRDEQSDNPSLLYLLARTRALLDDEEGAADFLRRSRAAGYDQPYFVLIDPAFGGMRDHPVIDEIAVPPR